ncbi:MAG: sugar transferase [Verrucomicrobiota bacterium]
MTPTSRRRRRHLSPQARSSQFSFDRFIRNRSCGFTSSGNQSVHHNGQTVSSDNARLDSPLPHWKRTSDVLLVLLVLPIIVFLSAAVYSWIQLVSPGNVLFRQTRIGRNGKPFTIYKFRSMKLRASTSVHEAHVEHLIKNNRPMTKLDVVGDSRLIKGGCLIRMSGLDELPQFINVLRGEMSLVGPRPCLPQEYELYDEHQRHRFSVQPGLTGQWQVNRNQHTTFSEMVKMDDHYVDHLSPVKDLQIILKTPLALLGQMKACERSKARKTVRSTSHVRSASPAFALSMSSTRKISD